MPARGANFRYMEAAGTVTITTQPTTLGIVTVGTKGSGGSTLTLYNAQTADANQVIATLDTDTLIGALDLGQIELDALTAVIGGAGTAPKVTLSWG